MFGSVVWLCIVLGLYWCVGVLGVCVGVCVCGCVWGVCVGVCGCVGVCVSGCVCGGCVDVCGGVCLVCSALFGMTVSFQTEHHTQTNTDLINTQPHHRTNHNDVF